MNVAADIRALARPEIRALKPYASARALADAAGILLNANENPYPPAGDQGRGLNRYPDPQPAALVTRLAELYGVPADHLLVTRGSDEGIDLLIRVFCCAGRDQVLINPPCFGMYALSARVQGAGVMQAPLIERDGDWSLPDDLEARAAECRITFLCSPNNPTGNVIPRPRAESLLQATAGAGLIVVDEAYVEFAPESSALDLMERHPNLVVLRTLSKAHALAGCRIGTVIARPEVIDLLRRIIAPYPLPTPTIDAALTALAPEAVAAEAGHLHSLAEQKQRLVAALEAHPAIRQVWPGHANFVLVRAEDGARLVRDALAADIRLRDQSAQPGLDDCVRISVGTPDETDALLEFMKGWTA